MNNHRGNKFLFAFLVLSWSTSAAAGNRGPDFDNDNIDDLVIGHPFERSSLSEIGMGNVLYGSASALDDTTTKTHTVWQGVTGSSSSPAADDNFGIAVAWGDFDGDCFDDLVVGTSEHWVQVWHGSPTGVDTSQDQFFLPIQFDTISVVPFDPVAFSHSLAVGDFNGDGFDDLAVGDPSFGFTNSRKWGGVFIMYGSAFGLDETETRAPQAFYGEDITGQERDSQFGAALVTGDFNCDGKDDLAIGAPHLEVTESGVHEAGGVFVLRGTSSGLTTTGMQTWTQAGDVDGAPEDGDGFGTSLAVGNFNNDTSSGRACHDLAIGSPEENVSDGTTNFADAGSVNVLYGSSASGLQTSSPADILLHQHIPNVEGMLAHGDRFGHALVAGNLDTDSFEDLVVGVPGDNNFAGAIAIFQGSATGLVVTGDQLWDQDTQSGGEDAESGDLWGWALAYGREWYTGLNRALAVGAPSETIGTLTSAGVVTVMYLQDTSTPTTSLLHQEWEHGDIGSQVTEASEDFGFTMAPPRDRPFDFNECD